MLLQQFVFYIYIVKMSVPLVSTGLLVKSTSFVSFVAFSFTESILLSSTLHQQIRVVLPVWFIVPIPAPVLVLFLHCAKSTSCCKTHSRGRHHVSVFALPQNMSTLCSKVIVFYSYRFWPVLNRYRSLSLLLRIHTRCVQEQSAMS